jgi:hypothetical protein
LLLDEEKLLASKGITRVISVLVKTDEDPFRFLGAVMHIYYQKLSGVFLRGRNGNIHHLGLSGRNQTTTRRTTGKMA